MNTVLASFKRSLSGADHRLSPKYAAHYLAEFEYRFNRCCGMAALPQRLLRAGSTAA